MPGPFSIRSVFARRWPGALLLALLAGCQAVPAPTPFATDGCSLFPDRLAGGADWRNCCVTHDLAYWRGGTRDERLDADHALEQCVAGRASRVLAGVMYAGVRLGGAPVLPTPFRWGFGWPYGRGYQPVSPAEDAQLALLRDAWHADNAFPTCTAHPL